MKKHKALSFDVNTPQLLREVFTNVNDKAQAALHIPMKVFGSLLAQVAERASELNDPIMNELMCKLALYEQADQYSPLYDRKAVNAVKKLAEKVRAA